MEARLEAIGVSMVKLASFEFEELKVVWRRRGRARRQIKWLCCPLQPERAKFSDATESLTCNGLGLPRSDVFEKDGRRSRNGRRPRRSWMNLARHPEPSIELYSYQKNPSRVPHSPL